MMRRKEKMIVDQRIIDEIIASAKVCRLGLADDNIPYIIPICFGYQAGTLYFHSAPEGKKIEISLDHIHILDPIMQNIETLEKRIEELEKRN